MLYYCVVHVHVKLVGYKKCYDTVQAGECLSICLVDGGWSEWQNVTECSATCGEGVITQQRTCTQPSPSCGGRDCVGENTTNVSCTECCPGM